MPVVGRQTLEGQGTVSQNIDSRGAEAEKWEGVAGLFSAVLVEQQNSRTFL